MAQFGPGEYRMRNGGRAVIYERFDGALYGRFSDTGLIWSVASWNDNGAWMFGRADPRDLLPPEPPLVIPEGAMESYQNIFGVALDSGHPAKIRDGLIAAFPLIAAANGWVRKEPTDG